MRNYLRLYNKVRQTCHRCQIAQQSHSFHTSSYLNRLFLVQCRRLLKSSHGVRYVNINNKNQIATFGISCITQYPSESLVTENSQVPNTEVKSYLIATDPLTENDLSQNMTVYENFLSETEEEALMEEVQSFVKRLRYEYDHWDDAIHGYREVERKHWSEKNNPVLQRVREIAFPEGVPQLAYVHVLDLEKSGYIKPHIDAVRFCGNTIAGLSLLSTAVMRLVNDKDKDRYADVLLQRRSLYVMKDVARYEYTHEILGEKDSKFRNSVIKRDRRVSIMFRNEPDPSQSKDS